MSVYNKICEYQCDNVFFHNEDGDVDLLKEIIGDPIFDVYEDTDKSFDECVDNNPTSDVVEKENDINFTNIQEMDPTLIDCVHVIGKFGMIDDTYLNVRNPLTYSNLASQSQFLNSDPPDRGHANFFLTNHHLEANSEPLDHVLGCGCHNNRFLRVLCPDGRAQEEREEPPDPDQSSDLFHQHTKRVSKDNVFFHNEDGDVDPLKEIIGDPIFDVYEDTDKSFDECVDNNPTSDVVEKENDINFTNIQEMDPTLIDCVHVIGKFGMIDDTYLNVRNPLTYSNLASQSQFLNSDPPDRGHANFFLTNHHLEANSEPLDHVVVVVTIIVFFEFFVKMEELKRSVRNHQILTKAVICSTSIQNVFLKVPCLTEMRNQSLSKTEVARTRQEFRMLEI
ncbi:hypothetical protein Bca52824_033540 [Brassica carinata]|uniref:Uncharacterized protein n=1 Tax=Brassica carinata TaxID=52824 RepID=A0A8X7V762_BRACI|nr:hypothetical protein Bca52824_033540 [Brassica carinata]